MPKIKTRKAVAKRFRVTAKGKVMSRKVNQNHFNSKQTSDRKRNKRTDLQIMGKIAKNVLHELKA